MLINLFQLFLKLYGTNQLKNHLQQKINHKENPYLFLKIGNLRYNKK